MQEISKDLQEALSQKDVAKLWECIPGIAALDEATFAGLKLALYTFGLSFPRREFEQAVQAEKAKDTFPC